MPGERAANNKTLVARCAACGKELATEQMVAIAIGNGRNRRLVPLCRPCREAGREPASTPA